jgi:hypothetical protein
VHGRKSAHGANIWHFEPAGQVRPPAHPTLHTVSGDPKFTPQCWPEGQSASLLQALFTQPPSPDSQRQLAAVHSQLEPAQKQTN